MNAIAYLAAGNADVLIVVRRDRLARDLTTQEAILAQCWGMDTVVHSADLGVIHADGSRRPDADGDAADGRRLRAAEPCTGRQAAP